nr:origin of replication complex subunit 5 [Ipomoea batatas]
MGEVENQNASKNGRDRVVSEPRFKSLVGQEFKFEFLQELSFNQVGCYCYIEGLKAMVILVQNGVISPSDFVNLLQEALVKIVEDLKMNAEKSGSKKSPSKGLLYDVLKMPEVGLIFVSATSPDTYYSDTGCVEPVHVYFPDYTEDDLHQIFMRRSQGNSNCIHSFLEAVLRPFCRVTRRVDELSTAFSSLFQIYCEGLDDLGAVPDEHMKNRLYCHLKPHIGPAMNEMDSVNLLMRLTFTCPTVLKYLLISAFIASRNPATLDASLFDSTGGCSSRKRKRKSSQKSMEQKEIAEQELVMKGPGTFPLERLLAIFHKGGSCPLEGSLRYRSMVSEDLALKLLLHRRTESNGYSSAKRCDKPSDFVNLLQEALVKIVEDLKMNAEKSGSKKSAQRTSGRMVYLIFDNLEHIREWNKPEILPFLFKLYDVLKMPEVGLIFVSATSPDTYYSDTGCVEPVHVYFPDYTEDDLHQIFMRRSQGNSKLYSSFLEAVLRPFCRVTRRVDELSTAFSSLFQIYCEGLDDLGAVPDEHMKNRLYCHLKPHIGPAMNEVFKFLSRPSPEVATNKIKHKVVPTKDGFGESSNEVDFHMSDCAKYLLISAFIASRNPATLDASLFDSTGGCSSRKRKRKSSQKSMEQKEIAEQELVMKGPGTFPLERLLAIFQCITSVSEYSTDEEAEAGGNNNNNGLMCDVLLQLSSLCNANFISKGGSCPLEGSLRYRSMVSEDLALKVARTLKFPLSKYLYR